MRKTVRDFWWMVGGEPLADSFQSRVEADSGTFEGYNCFNTILTALSGFNSSFLLTPNGYKASKLYSAKPTSGSGDFTFSRSTVGYRKGAILLEEMAVNTPRIDYLGQSCPTILLEPARTNLALRSQEFTNATWSKIGPPSVSSDNSELTGANGIWVSGNYAYVATFTGDALEIIDISNLASPLHVGKIVNGQGGALLNGPIGVIVSGNYAFVSSNVSNAVEVVDVSNPYNPRHAGSVAHGGGGGAGASLTSPWNMFLVGNYLYVASGSGASGALEILDVSTPTSPTHVGKISNGDGGALLATSTGVYVSGNYAYVAAAGSDALEIVDISTPSSPTHVGSIIDGAGGALLNFAHGVWVVGNYAFVCSRDSNALEVVDVSNPASPTHAASLTDGTGGANLGGAENIMVVGNYAYITAYVGNALEIVNISNPLSPSHVGKLENGTPLLDAANGIYVSGNYAYVASFDSNALEIADISVPATPSHVSSIIDNVVGAVNFRVMETAVTNVFLTRQVFTKAASALSYIAAIVVQGGIGRDWVCLSMNDGTNVAGKFFNITTGALGNDRVIGTGFSINESKIIDLGNEGYLCMIRVTSTTSTTFNFDVLISTDGSTLTYAGDTTKGIFLRKAKLIQSTAPLTDSYITTTTASVARTADAITPLTSVSSLIGQSEGTIFLWVTQVSPDSTSKAISISDESSNNRITLDFTTGNAINSICVAGGVTQATITNAGFSTSTEYKIAITYQSNKVALFVNGSKIGEDLTVTVPACSRIGFDSGAGSNPFYGNIKAFSLSQSALSDSSAQTLTTI